MKYVIYEIVVGRSKKGRTFVNLGSECFNNEGKGEDYAYLCILYSIKNVFLKKKPNKKLGIFYEFASLIFGGKNLLNVKFLVHYFSLIFV